MMQIENRMVLDEFWPAESDPLFQCEECDGDIYEGEEYYDFFGTRICEKCAIRYMEKEFGRTA